MKRQSMRMVPAAKMKMRLSTRRIVTSVALGVIMVSASVFFYLNVGTSKESMAGTSAVTNTAKNGAWSNPATWSSKAVPANGETIVIPAGVTVEITSDITFSATSKVTLNILGTLYFDKVVDLKLGTTSVVSISPSGNITSGNGSSRLYIGPTEIYKGNKGLVFTTASVTLATPSPTPLPAICTSPGACVSSIIQLPIRLISFTAESNEEGVILEWLTAAEENNDFYSIERSTDAKNFEAIQKVKGAGNSTEKLSYQAIDKAPLKETSYYRLRQTDFNGESTVSKIVPVTLNTLNTTASEAFKMYPNPAMAGGNLTVELPAESFSITLLDKDGKLVAIEPVAEGSTSVQVALTSVTRGLYLVKVQVGNKEQVQRLLIN